MTHSETNHIAYKIISILMSIVMAICSWFLSKAWDKISTIEENVHKLELTVSANTNDRFTSSDWLQAKQNIDSNTSALDRRIMRLEESLPIIKDSLLEINKKIDQFSKTP